MSLLDIFNASWKQLAKNKQLVIPLFIQQALPLILVLLFLVSMGIVGQTVEFTRAVYHYDQEQIDVASGQIDIENASSFLMFFEVVGKSDHYEEQRMAALEERGVDTSFIKKILTVKGISMISAFIIFLFVANMWLDAVASLAALNLSKKKKLQWRVIRSQAWSFLLRNIGIHLITGIIFVGGITLMILVLAAIGFVGGIIGIILAVLLGVVGFFTYIIYIGTRLVYATPVLFAENTGVFKALGRSWNLTMNRFKESVLVLLVIVVVYLVGGNAINEIAEGMLLKAILSSNFVSFLIIVLLALAIMVVGSAIIAFAFLFMFNAYAARIKAKK